MKTQVSKTKMKSTKRIQIQQALLTIVLACFIFLPTDSLAQNKVSISGKVVDEQSKTALEYSSVSILTAGDETLVTGSITNSDGEFEIKVVPGNYLVKIQYISYNEKIVNISLDEKNMKLGNIGLSINSQELDEVVVTARKEQFEFSLDKKTFNVGENISNLGRNASEILDNIPSVQVDIEGNVSLRGNQNVNILIDGKPSGMVGISSQDALRQLQGDMIERVEVITNPSARYDAEGTAGIINIVLKKDAKKGFNGTFGLSAGYPALISPNASINYRSGKFNFFLSAGLRFSRYQGLGSSYSTYFEPDSTFSTARERTHDRGGFSQNIRVGADYNFNDYNKITIAGLFNNANDENDTKLYYDDIANENIINTTERFDKELETEQLKEFSFNYDKTFEREGQKFTFYTQYRDNGEVEDSDISQTSQNDPDLFQRVLNDEGEVTLLMQADYVHPFGEKMKFETGLRSSNRNIRNNYLIEELVNGTWETLPRFTNDFEYIENIYAAYIIYGNTLTKFSYQAGLRVELTDIETQLQSESLDSTSTKNYINPFPSLHLSYEFVKDKNIQLSYSRRLRRPRFRDLNPISSYSDNRNFRVGNPDLDPELTDALELGYLQNWETASFYGGVYFNHTVDEIERLSFPSPIPGEEGVIYSRLYNLATEDAYGFEFNVSKDFTEWLSMNGSFNFYRRITSGEAEGQSFDADARSYSGRINTKVDLPKDVDFQFNVNYRGPQNTTQGKRLGFYTVDMGVTRDFFNGNGTLTANVRDLFNSRKYRNEQFDENFESSSVFQWRGRQIIVSFSYRLNQKKERRGGRGGNGNGGGDDDGGF